MEIRPVNRRPCVFRSSPCVKRVKPKYHQPARLKSYAPTFVYQEPTCPFATSTVYSKSYLPYHPLAYMPEYPKKPSSYIPGTTLHVPRGKFAKQTVSQLSYPRWNIEPEPQTQVELPDPAGYGPINLQVSKSTQTIQVEKPSPNTPWHYL